MCGNPLAGAFVMNVVSVRWFGSLLCYLCKRKSVAYVMYWSLITNKCGMLLSGALFCIEWSIPWFSAFGAGWREFLHPR
jgi:hypothetical protein